jgi:hypothetical protein
MSDAGVKILLDNVPRSCFPWGARESMVMRVGFAGLLPPG